MEHVPNLGLGLPTCCFPLISHLNRKNTHSRALFTSFSWVYATIIPQALVEKRRMLDMDTGSCNWLFNILPQHHQTAKVGSTSPLVVLPDSGPATSSSTPSTKLQKQVQILKINNVSTFKVLHADSSNMTVVFIGLCEGAAASVRTSHERNTADKLKSR